MREILNIHGKLMLGKKIKINLLTIVVILKTSFFLFSEVCSQIIQIIVLLLFIKLEYFWSWGVDCISKYKY